jgi:hypothetical protein
MRTITTYTKKGRPFIMRDMDETELSRSFGEGQLATYLTDANT